MPLPFSLALGSELLAEEGDHDFLNPPLTPNTSHIRPRMSGFSFKGKNSKRTFKELENNLNVKANILHI